MRLDNQLVRRFSIFVILSLLSVISCIGSNCFSVMNITSDVDRIRSTSLRSVCERNGLLVRTMNASFIWKEILSHFSIPGHWCSKGSPFLRSYVTGINGRGNVRDNLPFVWRLLTELVEHTSNKQEL